MRDTKHLGKHASKLAEEANSIVAIIGNGVIRSNSNKKLQKFLEYYDIPFYTSFQGKGAIRNDHRLNCGVLSRHSQVVKKVLEHIAVHRTIDIRQESRGKVHLLGRLYRKILEPICYFVGKHG